LTAQNENLKSKQSQQTNELEEDLKKQLAAATKTIDEDRLKIERLTKEIEAVTEEKRKIEVNSLFALKYS